VIVPGEAKPGHTVAAPLRFPEPFTLRRGPDGAYSMLGACYSLCVMGTVARAEKPPPFEDIELSANP
jgi:hypothetical protein